MIDEMDPMDRTMAALSHKEPDRVPVFMLLTMHGAKLLDMPLIKYLNSSEHMVKAQLKMRDMFGHDCLYALSYAAAEVKAFGGEVMFFEDGPPNAGRPIIQVPEDIEGLEPPDIESSVRLQETLKTIRGLKEGSNGKVPVIGVVMSPFSLPVMQMGFPAYLDLLYHDPEHFRQLMDINQRFCVEWANCQFEAGATAVAYFDPVSSTTMITREMYLDTGLPIAKGTISKLKGPTATHFASGRCLNILDDVMGTGTAAVGVSSLEDLSLLKSKSAGKVSLIGNLNGIEMARWDHQRAEMKVREAISKAAKGGGFVLSDNHGEIPYQVYWDVIRWTMDAARKHGKYPLNTTDR
ncbi:MAG: uroporphyrinogen decarboxylase family protein [Methanomassiliicoccales archaeon]|nr:uroporphyrinogen decarboxylase family protein [Methanomassiliicoccales archaeon]